VHCHAGTRQRHLALVAWLLPAPSPIVALLLPASSRCSVVGGWPVHWPVLRGVVDHLTSPGLDHPRLVGPKQHLRTTTHNKLVKLKPPSKIETLKTTIPNTPT
jgi:hypothetical protein